MKTSILVWLGAIATAFGQSQSPYTVSIKMDSYDTGRIIHILNGETDVNFLVILDENGEIPLSPSCSDPEIRFLAAVPNSGRIVPLAKINRQWRPYSLGPVHFTVSKAETTTDSILLIPYSDYHGTNVSTTVESTNLPNDDDVPMVQLRGTYCLQGTNVTCRLWNDGTRPAIVQYVPFRPKQNAFLLSPVLSLSGTTEDGDRMTVETPCGPNGIIDDVGPTFYSALPARSRNDAEPSFAEWESPLHYDVSSCRLTSCEAQVWVPCLEIIPPRDANSICSVLRTIRVVEMKQVDKLSCGFKE